MRKAFLIELRIKNELLIKPSQATVVRAHCHGFISDDNCPVVIIDSVMFKPMDLMNVKDNIDALNEIKVAALDAYKEIVRFVPLTTQMN